MDFEQIAKEWWVTNYGTMENREGSLIGLLKQVANEAAEKERERWKTVTRFEVIDHRKSYDEGGGRCFVSYGVTAEPSYQDDDRTLKIFVNNR